MCCAACGTFGDHAGGITPRRRGVTALPTPSGDHRRSQQDDLHGHIARPRVWSAAWCENLRGIELFVSHGGRRHKPSAVTSSSASWGLTGHPSWAGDSTWWQGHASCRAGHHSEPGRHAQLGLQKHLGGPSPFAAGYGWQRRARASRGPWRKRQN